jgi:hypothetical protein
MLSGYKQYFKKIRADIVSENLESALYNLFSNSIHALGVGLSTNSLRIGLAYGAVANGTAVVIEKCDDMNTERLAP